MGKALFIKPGSQSFQMQVQAKQVLEDVKIGDSIAVNGVCLTVVRFSETDFTVDVMPETVNKTTLKHLAAGSPVNLERALRAGDRLGGHIVQGHVDALGVVKQIEKLDIAVLFRIEAGSEILKYTVPKGSVAIDGISLTVIDVLADSFTVSLIPHTAGMTTLGLKKTGDQVNLESDIIGRYVEHLLKYRPDRGQDPISLQFLAENGFL